MRHPTSAVAAALVAVFLCAGIAGAQVPCGQRADILKALAEKYKEAPVNLGTVTGKGVIEIYASDAGTFTIIATQPNGFSCIIAAGDGRETFPPVADKGI